MGTLNVKKYASLCVLGGEVAYIVCLGGGTLMLRTPEASALHHQLFSLMPGFTWLTFGSFMLGAIYVAIASGIGGAYIAWMHNVSLNK